MYRLRMNIVLLIIGLSLFFYIDRIYISFPKTIQIEQFIYLHGVISVILVTYFPIFQRLRTFSIVFSNTLLLLIEKLIIPGSNPLLGGVYTYLTITEATLLSVLLYLAHQHSKIDQSF